VSLRDGWLSRKEKLNPERSGKVDIKKRTEIAEQFGEHAELIFAAINDELTVYQLMDHIQGKIRLVGIKRILQVRIKPTKES